MFAVGIENIMEIFRFFIRSVSSEILTNSNGKFSKIVFLLFIMNIIGKFLEHLSASKHFKNIYAYIGNIYL